MAVVPLDLDQVRGLIAARALTAPQVDGEAWAVSPFSYEQFGRQPASIRHLAFAVRVDRAQPVAGRRAPGPGGGMPFVESPVIVAFFHRVKPSSPRVAVAQTESEDAAARAEQALLRHLCALGWTTQMRLTWAPAGNTRLSLTGGEWLRHEIALTANHYFQL